MAEEKKIEDLRSTLFETIELLKKGEIDVQNAKAINSIAQTVVNSAKVEVDYIRAAGGEGSGFMPLEPINPRQLGKGGDHE